MSSSSRRQVRTSLLALVLAYLRDKSVSPLTLFPTYPRSGEQRSFSFNGSLYSIACLERDQPLLPLGVSIVFVEDQAESSRIESQRWDATIRIFIRSQLAVIGDSDARGIADLIDQALSLCNGKIEIADYDAATPSGTGNFLSWQKFPRGDWKFEPAEGQSARTSQWRTNLFSGIDQVSLEFMATYASTNL